MMPKMLPQMQVHVLYMVKGRINRKIEFNVPLLMAVYDVGQTWMQWRKYRHVVCNVLNFLRKTFVSFQIIGSLYHARTYFCVNADKLEHFYAKRNFTNLKFKDWFLWTWTFLVGYGSRKKKLYKTLCVKKKNPPHFTFY